MNRNWVYSLFALWIVCSFACTQPKPVANVDVRILYKRDRYIVLGQV